MIIEQLKEMKDFTNSEKLIAQYILENPSELQSLSAEDLGKRTFTSRATIVRFYKKLSLASYRDFQRNVEADLNEAYRIKSLISEEPVDETSTYKDILNIVPSIYELSVTNTKMIMDHPAMNRVLNKLKYSEKISIYGLGVSFTIAETTAFKLMTLGYEAAAYNGLNEHYVKAKREHKKDVAILISLTGNNATIEKIAKYMKENGIFVVGIFGSEYGEIKEYCDEILEIYSKKQILSLEIINALSAANYIIDVLFVSLLVQDYQQNVTASIDVLNAKDY